MCKIEIINSHAAPSAIGPYSQAISANGFVFLSGQIPINPETNEFVGGGIDSQTERVIANIKAVLSAAGLDLSSVVKTTCFLTDIADFAEFNSVYSKHFISKPARSTVAVKALPRGANVEIEVIALRDNEQSI